MLVLSRKVQQKLYIGKDICVTVVRLNGGQVRLGIEAPREVPVLRAELLAVRVPSAEPAVPGSALPERGPRRLPDSVSRNRDLTSS
ncbi:MAG TPA: carbon storage regulator [Isosphaeraceae bacterium]|jgi:carbon storage regulator|nr:carbon storage regulator [Isosphaeraceae bacterium]